MTESVWAHKAKNIYSLALYRQVCRPLVWRVEPHLALGGSSTQGFPSSSVTALSPGFLLPEHLVPKDPSPRSAKKAKAGLQWTLAQKGNR